MNANTVFIFALFVAMAGFFATTQGMIAKTQLAVFEANTAAAVEVVKYCAPRAQ